MKYFFDTEFIERGPHHPIDLISIGMVAENGWHYYAISSEFNPEDADPWVKENVLAKLGNETPKPLAQIAADLRSAIGHVDKPEFWAYYADYDWVVFCQMFGRMIDLPEGWPKFCRDLKQLLTESHPNVRLPKQETSEHNALDDAHWVRQSYEYLQGLPKLRS